MIKKKTCSVRDQIYFCRGAKILGKNIINVDILLQGKNEKKIT